MKTIKLGNSGFEVIRLQEILDLKADGYFGPITEDAVIEFQKMHNLKADGIVGSITWGVLLSKSDTNLNEGTGFMEYMMSPGRYVKNEKDENVWLPNYYTGPFEKQWLFFHHTAGWDNPYQTIDIWDKDNKTVATEFVVGGKNITGADRGFDGITLRCIPKGSYSAHLTVGPIQIHKESIGVELCNMGGLTKGGYHKIVNKKAIWVPLQANTFYTAYGNPVSESEVFDLGWTYRSHQYFHKYSVKQIEQCKLIAEHARDEYGIPVNKGLKELLSKNSVQKAFEFMLSYVNYNPGIYTHGHVFNGKNDIYPDPNFIEMIMSL
jgi:peptidoglycan hydrolase-like protein with peptidoglycan-binding domain